MAAQKNKTQNSKTYAVSNSKESYLQELGEFTRALSHEVNTPLSTIMVLAETVIYEIDNTKVNVDEIKGCCEKIISTIDVITQIMRSAMDVSKNSEREAIAEVPVSKLFDRAKDLVNERLIGKGVKYYLVPFDSDLTLSCRETEIVQVLVNFMKNSVDAIATLPEKWVRVGVEPHKNHMMFYVVDAGTGISDKSKESVFKPFFTSKKQSKGMGLGLTISKAIIEAHAGEIGVDETDGNTRFYFKVPRRTKI